jgi:hypothetical protein
LEVVVGRALLVILWALTLIAMAAPTRAADERLAYEIVLTLPGTRSQGWHGRLYDAEGKPVTAAPGTRVATDVGELVSVARTSGQMWKPFGMVPAAPGMRNDTAREPWSYRLYTTGLGTSCPAWRGDLVRAGTSLAAPADGAEVATPWGPFVWVRERGWSHKSWSVRTVTCR